MAELSRFLRTAMRTPLASGGVACLLLPADWWREITDFDPAGAWRGLSFEAASARVAAEGGVEAVTLAAMANVFRVTPDGAVRGDVGLVRARDERGHPVLVGAICTGRRWAARSVRGLGIGVADPIHVWRGRV